MWITTNPDNIPSIKVALKNGFKYVDTLKIEETHELYKAGDRWTNRYYKILETEAKEKQEKE